MEKVDPNTPKLTATCHCKAVRITFPTPQKPLTECLCSVCRRYGVYYTYYAPDEVQIEGEPTDFYAWAGKYMEFHRCKTCGCMTHWVTTERTKHNMVGVNCRMLERDQLARFQVKQSDGPKTKA